jgi:hypothetical protein
MYRSILFLLVSILILNGCSDDSTSSIIGNNLFPLTAGNKLEYETSIIDSSYTEVSVNLGKVIREIGSPIYIDGYYASPIYETTYDSTGALELKDTMYVYKTADDDTIRYYLKITLPLTDSTTLTVHKWAPMFIRSAGVAAYYNILDTTVTVSSTVNGTSYPTPIEIVIKNYIYDQETLTVPESSTGYKCNEIELFYLAYHNGILMREGTYYQVWFADGIGPIKERRFYYEKNIGRNISLSAKTIK